MKYLRSQSSLEMKAGWQPRFSFYECSFFPLFLLEYNCFTMLLVSAVQWSESAICIHLSPCSWASFQHPPHLTPPGHHRTLSWAPCAVQQLPTSYFTHDHVCPNLTTHPIAIPSPHVHMSVLYVYVSIPPCK